MLKFWRISEISHSVFFGLRNEFVNVQCSYTECKLNPGSVTNIGITEDNKNSNGAAGLLVPGNNDSKSRKD